MTDWIQLRETKLQTGAVLEDYRFFSERKAYYVDKTWFIREFLRDSNQVVMYTRPRRFGKTLMLSIIRAFVEKEYDRDGNLVDKRLLFEGRKILNAEPEILDQMGKYPIISFSLKDCDQNTCDLFIVLAIDNVNKDKSPFSNGEGGFRGMGLVLKSMARTIADGLSASWRIWQGLCRSN